MKPIKKTCVDCGRDIAPNEPAYESTESDGTPQTCQECWDVAVWKDGGGVEI